MKYFMCFFMSLPICAAIAQIVVKGKVVNQKSNHPIPYVNIGIAAKPIGTLSNPDGTFTLYIPKQYQNDTLIFSSVGYNYQKIQILSINPYITVTLNEKIIQLEAVTVSNNKKTRIFSLGNKYSNTSYICADSAMAGSAMALLIENKFPRFRRKLKNPFFLLKTALRIYSNTFNQFKVRVRILEYDSLNGLPGKDLLEQNVIITSKIKTDGWINADLSKYNIQIKNERFFLVFEWVLDDIDRQWLTNKYKEFMIQYPEQVKVDTALIAGKKSYYIHWKGISVGTLFSASNLSISLNNQKCFFRTNSHGEWKRSTAVMTALIYVTN